MTKRTQRENELRQLAVLQRHCPELSEYVVAPQQPPEPDFCAVGTKGRLGIELTEFSGNLLARREEGEQELIVRSAQALYDPSGPRDVHVVVNWQRGYQLSKRDRALDTLLAELVARNRPNAAGGTAILDSSSEATTRFVHPAFERVWVFRVEKPLPWTSIHRWDGVVAGPELVQREIDRKNEKPSAYRQHYLERWLVLVHLGHKPSTGFDLSDEITSYRFTSSFDRVLVLGLTPARVVRLNLRKNDGIAHVV